MDREKIRHLPDLPGVYLMKDAGGGIIYIGKASSLRKRVSSYFRPEGSLDAKTAVMMSKAADIGFTVTASEEEALILEAALIKEHRPRYNVSLRDDKTYPYLKLTMQERFPRLLITRTVKNDGSSYYGPYTSAKLLRRAVRSMQRLFPLRQCRAMPKSPCLNYHMGQCPAPCGRKISAEGYAEIVGELRLFLDGRKEKLIDLMAGKMGAASKARDYEKAGYYRDAIRALSAVPSVGPGPSPYDELVALQSLLRLKRLPERIEAFDISNIGGRYAVGSMVVFVNGRPSKNDYRKFRIRAVSGADDYAMMREVVGRRYERVKKERLGSPDLVVIDGGKGHRNAAVGVLRGLGLDRIPVIGIAKEFERVYLEGHREYVSFRGNSYVIHLIQRLRDEAHRFAIGYHRLLMEKRMRESGLDLVRGVGSKSKKALLERFGSLEAVARAGIDELCGVRGIDEEIAKRIKEHLKR